MAKTPDLLSSRFEALSGVNAGCIVTNVAMVLSRIALDAAGVDDVVLGCFPPTLQAAAPSLHYEARPHQLGQAPTIQCAKLDACA